MTDLIPGIGFQPTKRIMFSKNVTDPCYGIQVWDARDELVRFDKDGFVVNFKPGGGFQYSVSDFDEECSSSKPIRKIRKLPNKQLWKVYYT